jgi:N-methylhydantoinase A
VLTGAIDPHRFAGGRIKLRPELSSAALQSIASTFDLSVVGAARAIISLAEGNMINALKLVTIQRGHDPRDLTMVVSGGGGPLHAAALGRELGVKRVVIPGYAGLFSAWGMLTARPRIDLHRTQLLPLDATSVAAAEEIFGELEREALQRFGSLQSAILFSYAIDMRYAGQEHTVATPFEPGAGYEALLIAFHAAHEKAYTFCLPDTKVELVTFHLTAEIDTPRVGLPDIAVQGTAADAIVGQPATMALCLHRFMTATACRPAQSSKGRRWWKRRPRQPWCGPGSGLALTVSVYCQSKSADEVRWRVTKDTGRRTSTTLADLFTLRARADLFSAVWASLRWRSGR